jgi:hypothetical protein
MRPVRIIATAVFVAALAVTGCSSRTADHRTGVLSPVVSPHNPANHALNR